MTMRGDGRRPDELRTVAILESPQTYAEGSVLIKFGRTEVLCSASVETSVPPWLKGRGQGWLTAEYSLLPRATHTRNRRERSGLGGRTQEIQRLIGRSLRAAVDLEQLGERTITLDCDVIQADGGTRTAAITGACVALELAVQHLLKSGALSTSPLRTRIAAVSVGIVDGVPLLDLAYAEDSRADVDGNVVQTAEGALVEVQTTAEGRAFSRQQLAALLDYAEAGITELFAAQQAFMEHIRKHGL